MGEAQFYQFPAQRLSVRQAVGPALEGRRKERHRREVPARTIIAALVADEEEAALRRQMPVAPNVRGVPRQLPGKVLVPGLPPTDGGGERVPNAFHSVEKDPVGDEEKSRADGRDPSSDGGNSGKHPAEPSPRQKTHRRKYRK